MSGAFVNSKLEVQASGTLTQSLGKSDYSRSLDRESRWVRYFARKIAPATPVASAIPLKVSAIGRQPPGDLRRLTGGLTPPRSPEFDLFTATPRL